MALGIHRGAAEPLGWIPNFPPSLLQLSRQSGADGCDAIGCRAALVPTTCTLPHPSITGGALISLLFCHANYSKLVKRPPHALNDRENVERGQMGGGEGSQSLCAGWHFEKPFQHATAAIIVPL